MKWARPTTVSLAALALLLAGAGCSLEWYADRLDEDGIVAVFPGDGAAAVPETVLPAVELGWTVPGDAQVDATLSREGAADLPLTCQADPGDDRLWWCPLDDELLGHTAYTLTAEIRGRPGTRHANDFTSRTPAGEGYEIGATLAVTRMGANSLAAPLLNAMLTADAPLLLLSEDLHAEDELPALGAHWLWGPGRQLDDLPEQPYMVRESVGYPFAAATDVDAAGAISGSADYAYLPVALDGEWHALRIDDVTVAGRLDPDTTGWPVEELLVEGYVSVSTALRTAARMSASEERVMRSLIDLDTDTDGDGVDDAARLVLETQPVPASIQLPPWL